ncbi:hypothetical protein ACLMAJ_20215 [Nocardia sp. KC 131]|uniref:hypothetical protein n=1 Tax=Nocardia arseniciresistens TaxID=3392119 RepID=UPI00398E8BFD
MGDPDMKELVDKPVKLVHWVGIAALIGVGIGAASGAGGDGGSGGGGDGGGDQQDGDGSVPTDQQSKREKEAAPEEWRKYLEGPLDTGLPGNFDKLMDPNGDYLPGDPEAELAIRNLRANRWQIRFTEAGTIKGDTYMDYENVNEDGLRTLWLSTDLMNLPPEKLMAAIAKAID